MNDSYSNRREIMDGVPKGSVLGLLPFNIDLIELFLEGEDNNVSSYVDDTPYSCAEEISSVITELQRTENKVFRWFENKSCSVNMQWVVPFNNVKITSSLSKKLLGITFDAELKFEEHISKICNIVNKKLNAHYRIANHMSLGKQKWF